MACLLLADAQVVLHVGHPGDALGDVLGPALLGAGPDRAGERRLPVLHRDLDLGRVDHGVVGEPLVDVLADALVGTLVASGTPALMLAAPHLAAARGGVVAE